MVCAAYWAMRAWMRGSLSTETTGKLSRDPRPAKRMAGASKRMKRPSPGWADSGTLTRRRMRPVRRSSSATIFSPPLPLLPPRRREDDDEEEDDEDEDEINSELDDHEDETNQINDDDDDNGDTILCTYDKVQRVKNKWKCTLKDGVLNANGKEWLFHKGELLLRNMGRKN